MATPKVFLSSTVRDFRDLRSAMKFWLEEYGFGVLASEWPDFPHAIDREAIDASLAPIADCDYYVLLIGRRAGAIIPESRISVTRAEFRRARELRRATGRPQMLHFVRAEVTTARHIGRPADIPAPDWTHVLEFLEEVETAKEPGDPNWLRSFSSFRDVADALRATLRITGALQRRALEANLAFEIVENTKELLFPTRRGTRSRADRLTAAEVPIPAKGQREVFVGYPGTDMVFDFRLALPRLATWSRSALEEAINSGQFLNYDASAHAFVVGPFQQCLMNLRQQSLRLDGLAETLNRDENIAADMARAAAAARDRTGASFSEFTLLFLHAARGAMENVLRLNRAVYRRLVSIDASIQAPPLLSSNPRADDNSPREDATSDEAAAWLRSSG